MQLFGIKELTVVTFILAYHYNFPTILAPVAYFSGTINGIFKLLATGITSKAHINSPLNSEPTNRAYGYRRCSLRVFAINSGQEIIDHPNGKLVVI